ncbi:MAG: hypothetical protein LBH17_07895 [Oscillospiraceae bacterium]|jgi:hypothetical protein|nr:hypothetical protein [Oscillospiraceae bacterium]
MIVQMITVKYEKRKRVPITLLGCLLTAALALSVASCAAPSVDVIDAGDVDVNIGNVMPIDVDASGDASYTDIFPTPTHVLSDEDLTTLRDGEGVLEIREKLFIAQCNDIYLNPEEYAGRRVRIEGMYYAFAEEGGAIYYSVTRLGPGCCGNDGVAGFEFTSDPPPECVENDWISVEGTLMPFVYDDGYESVIIADATVTVKTERGAEYVTQ